jgi:hypothetical protein
MSRQRSLSVLFTDILQTRIVSGTQQAHQNAYCLMISLPLWFFVSTHCEAVELTVWAQKVGGLQFGYGIYHCFT